MLEGRQTASSEINSVNNKTGKQNVKDRGLGRKQNCHSVCREGLTFRRITLFGS
jgi:hypothetical protein